MDGGELLRLLWSRKWRIVLVAAVAAGVVFGRSATEPERFEADVTVAVEGDTSVVGSLGTPGALGVVAESAGVRAHPGAGFLRLSVVDDDPREAERVLAGTVEALSAELAERSREAVDAVVGELEIQAARAAEGMAALPVGSPERTASEIRLAALHDRLADLEFRAAPVLTPIGDDDYRGTPVSRDPVPGAVAAFIAALLAAAALVVAVERLSDRFAADRRPEEVLRVTGLPLLAEIPRGHGAAVVEAIRTLRTSLMFTPAAERLRTLAVVSAEAGTGKGFVALNLAAEAAALDVAVLVVDADLRHPDLHRRLGVPLTPGLSEALTSGDGAPPSIHRVDGISVLTAGSPVPDPAALLSTRPLARVLAPFEWAELIVVDTPAGRGSSDGAAVASQCDATLVVLDARTSRRRDARRLVAQLRQLGAVPVGVVVNRADPVAPPAQSRARRAHGDKTASDPAEAAEAKEIPT